MGRARRAGSNAPDGRGVVFQRPLQQLQRALLCHELSERRVGLARQVRELPLQLLHLVQRLRELVTVLSRRLLGALDLRQRRQHALLQQPLRATRLLSGGRRARRAAGAGGRTGTRAGTRGGVVGPCRGRASRARTPKMTIC